MDIIKDYIKELESILGHKLNRKDRDRLIKAYKFGEEAHKGQMRDSGDPFFEHPKEVALILAGFRMDIDTIIAGLLHDTVEDCDVPIEKIEKEFGIDVSRIVNGVTKISNLKLNERLSRSDMKSIEKIETIRKMLLAMSTDIRVIVVKLSDRLHNMRTLDFVKRDKQVIKSEETLKIYAPIAHRLGINKIKAELEDLSFKYLHPDIYTDLDQKLKTKLSNRQKSIDEYADTVKEELKKHRIKADVSGRAKHLYSIWNKMLKKGKTFDDIYDIIALRIITENQNQCYASLGIVHSMWAPMPGRIKDYIATPKFNGYKSLHTTVITNKGEPLEIQIRDWNMHEEAEFGLAAHWAYKQGVSSQKVKFLQNLMELHKDIAQSAFDIKDIETNLLSKEIFVFTPQGEIIHLPKGATPIDFAYAIHTDIGNHFAGAKINGRIVPISYKLQNSDVVEIIVNRNFNGPSIDWIKHAKSPRTASKIKKFYRQKNEKILVDRGKDKFRELAKKLNISIEDMLNKLKEEAFFIKYNIKNDEDLYIKIELEDVNIQTIRSFFVKDNEEKEQKIPRSKSSLSTPSVIVDGVEGIDTHFAKCCTPVPGDDIIGIIGRRGIGIHRTNCKNIRGVKEDKKLNVEWNTSENQTSFVAILSLDMESKKVMNSVRDVLKAEKGYIEKFEILKQSDILTAKIRLKVTNIEHLIRITHKIQDIKGIFSVRRM
ncbi:RelA/SpoT family protein [Geotoga petraea]|jgi:GTP pyrophosphokinase|uniref:Bifunctional (P)ppGpp synthetase/guanosine-3',5'-bis(Diphosphate) 3'-pyrophosphohydrolase n=1 Tax=Geotoga petraea TaxID=28234 RepID=A0A1G6JXC3_9BACT|nr:bifunctional (p)ppGpp synthetase/guanosine-3',5'-bis(diphosphate) 3'-pyrophosphohydrolase [Geotoga petraea]MDK2945671.1 diphosphokinase / guanosine-3,5-bis(diphosphate) 3-diphosphatase [Geotoga sp.]TGG88349.1 bifunctional (p)ppGpp synthetase/guanosine-3',5'-bis(diphosphate) 3'-pyrophosphohydrolase [Geotoga petraea]SDC23271.1 GTP pyrophosphokinase [Geotoga petraea]